MARGEPEQALALLEGVTGSFQADGLAARLRLEARGLCVEAFAVLDGGDTRGGLQALLAALPGVEDQREEVRRAIVGELDLLGPEDPLARETRRQLAAALY
jgi:putative thioredoxin